MPQSAPHPSLQSVNASVATARALESLESLSVFVLQQANALGPKEKLNFEFQRLEAVEEIIGTRKAGDYGGHVTLVRGLSHSDFKRLKRLANAFELLVAIRENAESASKYFDAVRDDLIPALHNFISSSSQIQSVLTLGLARPIAVERFSIPPLYRDYLRSHPEELRDSAHAKLEAKYSTIVKKLSPLKPGFGGTKSLEGHFIFKGYPATITTAFEQKSASSALSALSQVDPVITCDLRSSPLFDFRGLSQATGISLVGMGSKLRRAIQLRKLTLDRRDFPLVK